MQFTSASDPSEDPKFSPDSKRVAYVRKHNLYVRSVAEDEERQLTKDKDENLLNGEVDWVYEEELDVRGNYFWSPDGNQIVFLQMNETKVPAYPITDWLPTNPEVDEERYPKPGDPDPAVRLGVVSAKGGGHCDLAYRRLGHLRPTLRLGAGRHLVGASVEPDPGQTRHLFH